MDLFCGETRATRPSMVLFCAETRATRIMSVVVVRTHVVLAKVKR